MKVIEVRLFDIDLYSRRKFRSQTSDNMDRWKAEMGRVREKRRVEERRSEKRKSQKKEDADARMREKVGKSRNTVFFQWFVALEGRKVGSLKRRVRSHLARWEMKKCTPLCREAHFEVKMHKTHQVRTCSDHFWKLRCRKHISKSKCTKHTMYGPLLEVEMSKTCTPSWREAHFKVKMYKTRHVRAIFGRSDVVSHGRRKGLWTLSQVSKTWGFCGISKNDGRRGTFEEDLQRCIFRGWGSTRDMLIRAVRRSGRWFPERGCILEHQIFRFAQMILRDRRSTSYDLASLFRGRRNTLDRWTGKIAKRIGTRPSALHSTFHFWRKSRRILSFLMLSTSKNEEVSQNCFVFWCCQLQNMRKSRRSASFLMLSTYSTSKNEEVSQNCFVFDVVTFKYWGRLRELLRFWWCQLWKMRKSRRLAAFLMLSTLNQWRSLAE